MWRNADYVKKISEAVDQIGGVCERCKLRYCGNKSSPHHCKVMSNPGLSNQDVKSADPEQENQGPPDAKIAKVQKVVNGVNGVEEALCIACCGVLQDSFMSNVLEEVSKEMKDSDYVSDHFMVAISVPVSLMLREHALKIRIDEITKGEFDEEEVPAVKQVWKWVFSPRLAKRLGDGMTLVTGDNCEFYIELQLDAGTDEADLESLDKMCQGAYSKKQAHKKRYNAGSMTRQAVEKSLGEVSDTNFKRNYPVPPLIQDTPLTHKVKMYHNSFYVAGRYNKYSRELPQTPWLLDGKRVMESSVEEMIADPLKKLVKMDGVKFGSSGREDVDVRMLGEGRPFLLEVVNARRVKFSAEEMRSFQQSINKASAQKVFIRDLQIVSKSDTKILKDGEDNKQKVYEALCVLTLTDTSEEKKAELLKKIKSLSETPNIELAQKTPVRVLHRRANAERTRNIYWMKFNGFVEEKVSEGNDKNDRILFKLELCTQAGTYVKEFVHGDFGRTTPNLSTILGCDDVDILALDVKNIVMDWPPRLRDPAPT